MMWRESHETRGRQYWTYPFYSKISRPCRSPPTAIDIVSSRDFTMDHTIRHSQLFAFTATLRRASCRKDLLRFHAVAEMHARVRSSRALTFQSHDEGNLFAHHYAFGRSERGSDPGISHYFLATAGINHLFLHPVALCNFSFDRPVRSCVLFLRVLREKNAPL